MYRGLIVNKKKEESVEKHPRQDFVDNFSRQVIKNKIFYLYSQRQLPTVRLIQDLISDSIDISDTTLRKVLYEIGFCWRRTTDDRRVAIEKNDAKASRAAYIRAVQQYRRDGLSIVYMDETWVNACHIMSYAWLPQYKHLGIAGDQDMIRSFPKIPPGKGRRLIILHSGILLLLFIIIIII